MSSALWPIKIKILSEVQNCQMLKLVLTFESVGVIPKCDLSNGPSAFFQNGVLLNNVLASFGIK